MLNVFIQHLTFTIQHSSVSLFRRSPTRPTRPSAPSAPSPSKSPASLRPIAVGRRLGVGRGAGGRRGRGGGGRLGVRPRATTTSPATSPRTLLLLLLLLRRATLLAARLGPWRLPFARKLLLELLHLLLHKLPRCRLLPSADLVVPAVRAAAPAFGISLFASRAENALRQRHLEFIPSRADGEGSLFQQRCSCATRDASPSLRSGSA
jgi:hypothetical protein